MSALVEELLLLSQADADRILPTSEPVLLRDILLAAIETTPGRDTCPIVWEPSAISLFILGNPGLLTRLFANLLHNAVRHTPGDQPIIIRTRLYDTTICIEVEDEGEGIAPEHLPYVCDRFYRADSARAQHQGGSGLGLAICKSIAEAHGGTIHLQSTVGTGTIVTVCLPVA